METQNTNILNIQNENDESNIKISIIFDNFHDPGNDN